MENCAFKGSPKASMTRPSKQLISSFTTSVWNKPRAFTECTNTVVVSQEAELIPFVPEKNSMTHNPISGPNTGYSRIPPQALSQSPSAVNTRRLQRYSTAEGELATRFEKCTTEASPRELEIRALEKVTAILNEYAQESRKRAEKLRAVLSDRGMDPEVYETLKRERWMEERRQSAMDYETQIVRQHLESLMDPSQQSKIRIPTSQDTSEVVIKSRYHRNLIKFLESSKNRPLIPIRKSLSTFTLGSPRRKTLDRVSPMQLRASSTEFHSSTSTEHHLRSVSSDGREFGLSRPLPFADSRNIRIPVLPASLKAVNEDPFYGMVPSPVTEPAELPQSALTSCFCSQSTAVEFKAENDYENGTAIIYPTLLYPHLQPINDEDIRTTLPDYAVDLFSQFDVNHDIPSLLVTSSATQRPPHLPLPSRIPSSDQNQAKHNSVSIPDLPSASSMLQVPSLSPKPRDSRVKRAYSQFSSLAVIPEALSSRISVNSGQIPGVIPFGSGLFTKSRGHNDVVPSASTVSLTDSSEGKDNLTSKIKRRFSMLRSNSHNS